MSERFSIVQRVRFGDLDALQPGGSAPYSRPSAVTLPSPLWARLTPELEVVHVLPWTGAHG
jgi:hypothetical protein